jgi:hypothetical protein
MEHLQIVAEWAGINIVIGVFGPLIVGRLFVRYNVNKPHITLRQFYEKGELGLAGLLIALSVIFDVEKSAFTTQTTRLAVFCLYFLAAASAYTWAVPLCNNLAKTPVRWRKVWRDSSRIALMVFSIGLVTEIILETL